MKKTFLLFITLILSFICIDTLDAITGYTTEAYVAVRSEPRVASNTFIYQFPSSNATLDIIETNLHNVGDPSCSIGWYKINYNGREAYICGNYVSIGALPDDNPNYNEQTFEARVTDTRVSVRPGPTYNNTAYHVLAPGTNVRILEKVAGQVSNTCSDGWYKIKYYKDSTGYICASYVNTKEELTASDADYENYLRGLGFPDSYLPYLVKLHQLHPAWSFTPVIINYSWENIVAVEAGKNSIHKEYANNIIKNIYTYKEHEPNFLTVTSGVDAFYLDPRNSLTEKFVFMFESQKYNYGSDNKNTFDRNSASSKKYYDLVSYVIPSGLKEDKYIYAFIEAGFIYNVSPLHLVSRVKQEGSDLTGETNLTYRGYNLNGYYNLFNIGAYIDDFTGNPAARGLAYACGKACGFDDTNGRPWNTIEKSINGGAYHISKNYVSQTQNLLYFEKFNTNEPNFSSVGTFQYMSNILAPTEESLSIYNTYKKNGKLDDPFMFEIPVYKDMPAYVSLPEIASSVNTLNEILVNGKKITTEEMDITDYLTYVSDTLTTVEISGTKTDANSTVIGLGTITLTGEVTEHKIVVTAENGNVKTYNITIKKAKETTEDIVSKLSVKINGDVMYGISPDTYVSTLEQSVAKVSPSATVTVTSTTNNVVPGSQLLATGQSVKITASSGETKIYRLAVTGDTNGDGIVDIVDLLRIQKHVLNTTKLNGINFIGGDTNNDGAVDIADLLKIQKHILKIIKL